MSPCQLRRSAALPALATLLALLLAVPAAAQTLYQVELVVFARDSAEAEIEESWQRDHGLRYPKRLVGLAPAGDNSDPSQAAAPFQLLPAAARKLNESARALDRRSNLRVLFHGAWVQPAAGLDSADPVLITGGNRFGTHTELEGYVVLTVERYLHLRADLWMTRFGTGNALDADVPVLPTPVVTVGSTAEDDTATSSATHDPQSSTAAPGYIPDRIYTLDQERRMRLGEVHYIDHPRFGLLVQISPYTPPEPPAPVAPPAASGDTSPISTAP